MKTSKALLIGHLWVTMPAVLIALISFGLPLYVILEYKLSPGWIFPSLIIPLGFGILTYSFFVVKWKIWALSRVQNVHELAAKGFQHGLFYPLNSSVTKTEIKSKKDRETLSELYKRFNEPIPEVPSKNYVNKEFVVKTSNWYNLQWAIIYIGSAIYFMFDYKKVYALIAAAGLFAWGLTYLVKVFRQNIKIVINESGLKINQKAYEWKDIQSYSFEKRPMGKFFYDYLILLLKDSGEIKICVEKLNVSTSDLDYQIMYFSRKQGSIAVPE